VQAGDRAADEADGGAVVVDGVGDITKQGRHKVGPSSDDPAWKPLWCEHRGSGRIAWTPLLMHSERVGGQPRQKLLHRLPMIRSCCIEDRFIRAAWWHAVQWWLEFCAENDGSLEIQLTEGGVSGRSRLRIRRSRHRSRRPELQMALCC
jgi:hypothetical protein